MQFHHIHIWSGVALIVHHQGNTAINCTSYGVLITQSYPTTLGTPGNGVTISVSNFVTNKASADWMISIGHQLLAEHDRRQCQEWC